jgi:hypothetical protein
VTIEGPEFDDRCEAFVDECIVSMQEAGISEADIGQALIAFGLIHFRGCMCAKHVLEQIAWVREFMDEKVIELRKECG